MVYTLKDFYPGSPSWKQLLLIAYVSFQKYPKAILILNFYPVLLTKPVTLKQEWILSFALIFMSGED